MTVHERDINVASIATRLLAARDSGVPIDPIDADSHLTPDQAYEIQREQVRHWVSGGQRVVGHKIGLTSAVMQQQFGVHEPDYGHLTSSMFYLESQPISAGQFVSPRIEPEIAVVLRGQLTGPGVTSAEATSAVDYVLPALEIIDSRIRDWKITLADTIADNASSGGVILGSTPSSLRDLARVGLSLRTLGCMITRGGQLLGTGAGGAALGSPMNAVVWLANALGRLGISLEAGAVVLTGSITAAVPVQPNDTVTATFTQLGSVTATFTD